MTLWTFKKCRLITVLCSGLSLLVYQWNTPSIHGSPKGRIKCYKANLSFPNFSSANWGGEQSAFPRGESARLMGVVVCVCVCPVCVDPCCITISYTQTAFPSAFPPAIANTRNKLYRGKWCDRRDCKKELGVQLRLHNMQGNFTGQFQFAVCSSPFPQHNILCLFLCVTEKLSVGV